MALTDRVRERVNTAIDPHLMPDERLLVAAIGTRSRRRRQFLLSLVNPMLTAFTQRPYYVALTDRRLLVLKPGLARANVVEEVLAEPRSTVRVEGARHGRLRSVLALRRQPSDEEWRFEFGRTWRSEVMALEQALGA